MKQILVEVHPRSSQNKVEKITDSVFKVWLTAQPIEGRANQALVKILAEYFGVAKSNIEIKTGKTSKNKVVIIYG